MQLERQSIPLKFVEFFELRTILDAIPLSATWETIETMDKIGDMQWRDDDELNTKTSQFSNPPNYKVNASNATDFQDSNLRGLDKFSSSADGAPSSSKTSSVNTHITWLHPKLI